MPPPRPRENRDQRAAETEPHQRLQDAAGRHAGGEQDGVVDGDREQGEADHQHAGDGAGLERDRQRSGEAGGRRLGSAHVGAHGDVHADIAGRAGQYRADDEADADAPAEHRPEDHRDHHADDRDGPVLAVEVGAGAGLHRVGDFPHAFGTGVGREHRSAGMDTVEQRHGAAGDDKPQLSGHELDPLLNEKRAHRRNRRPVKRARKMPKPRMDGNRSRRARPDPTHRRCPCFRSGGPLPRLGRRRDGVDRGIAASWVAPGAGANAHHPPDARAPAHRLEDRTAHDTARTHLATLPGTRGPDAFVFPRHAAGRASTALQPAGGRFAWMRSRASCVRRRAARSSGDAGGGINGRACRDTP